MACERGDWVCSGTYVCPIHGAGQGMVFKRMQLQEVAPLACECVSCRSTWIPQVAGLTSALPSPLAGQGMASFPAVSTQNKRCVLQEAVRAG